MTISFKKSKKILFLLLIFGFLFFFLNLFYNQNRKSEAQEVELVCEGDEIPLGEVLDEALALAKVINDNVQTIYKSSLSQIDKAKSLFDFPDQCTVDNCQTSCNKSCPDQDADGVCDPEEKQCTVNPCSGNPCPPEAENLVNQIQNYYNQIADAKGKIDGAVLKREEVIEKLGKVRKELAKCVTPAGELTEAEAREAKTLFTCQEAKYQRALPSGKTDCDNPNNFVCCHYK